MPTFLREKKELNWNLQRGGVGFKPKSPSVEQHIYTYPSLLFFLVYCLFKLHVHDTATMGEYLVRYPN